MSSGLSSLGLNFLVGLSDVELQSAEKKQLRELRPAGIILFRRNVSQTREDWTEKLRLLILKAQEEADREDFFVSIDHEGGAVHRLIEPITHFPPAQCWGDKSADVARAMAAELRSLLINLSFAPVLDIDSEAKNPIIGKRAFSSDVELVCTRGVEFITALEQEGVLACGKHFPGHGATLRDSHLELPIVSESKEVLHNRELAPFRAGIECGLRMIMTAHVVYPELDSRAPATLSENILRNLLRNELGYQHLIISDALEMKALDDVGALEAVCRALRATVDILLVAQPEQVVPVEHALSLARHLHDALDRGELEEALIHDSQERIQSVLQHLKKIKPDVKAIDDAVLGCSAHQTLRDKLT